MVRVLALDVGTSSIRALVHKEDGEPGGEIASRKYETTDPDQMVEAVRSALEEALGGAESHQHGVPRRSSHHGDGSLPHLALATHMAPAPQPLPPAAPAPELRVFSYAPDHLPPRYLVAERSQGPPPAPDESSAPSRS